MTSEQAATTRFTRILFEEDVLSALSVLLESLLEGEFDQAVEWLTAWQDLIDSSSSPLTPLLEALQEEDASVVQTSLKVLNGLVSTAPDKSRQFRIKNELRELKFEQLLGQVSLRWEKSVEIRKEVENWFKSSEEEENTMAPSDVEPVLSDLRSLLADDAAKEERIRVVLGLLDTLKNVKNTDDAENTLKKLNEEANEKTVSPAPVAAPKAPPPPPPPPTAPPPPVLRAGGPPPPPPPPSLARGPPGAPPPPPPPGGLSFPKPPSVELPPCMKPRKVPDKDVKMKTLMWSKLPPSALTNEAKASVWGQLAAEPRGFSLDFEVIEGMFSLASAVPASDFSSASSMASFKKKDTMVDLLTPKRSQNVTITLKRFKNLDAVLTNIRENNADAFDLEMLRALKGILPDAEEIDALKRYSGDVALLAPACSFFLQILSIQDYRLRIDCLCFRLEFRTTIEEVLPQLKAVAQASLEILQSSALKRLLLLLVNIGNFLNGATAHGNAAGFKLNSLWKMIDMKAAKGGASLLHALAKMDTELLNDLEQELPTIKAASEISIEESKTNLRQLTDNSKALEKNISGKEDDCFQDMMVYLKENCGVELEKARSSLETITTRQDELAAYFCENRNSFRAEECFKIFSNFVARLRVAVQENQERAERAAKKMVRQSASDESVSTLAKDSPATPQAPEEKLFSALEKGSSSLKISRRRSSVRTAFEFSRERDADQEVRLKKLTEESKEDSTPRTMTRRSRRSLQMEGAATLTDLMERLQATTFPRPSSTATPRVPEEVISVNIPSESDGCQSTPSTSPKSSDEGFESEKDKEGEKAAEESPVPPTPSTASSSSSSLPRRPSPPKTLLPPRLISITTTGPKPRALASTLPKSSATAQTGLVKPKPLLGKAAPLASTLPKPSIPKRDVKPTTTTFPRPVAAQPTVATRKSVIPAAKTVSKPAAPTVTRPAAVRKPSVPAAPAQRTTTAPTSATKPVAAPRRLPAPRTPLSRAVTTDSSSTSSAKTSSSSSPVSTSARPSLIKTGSLSQPRPLRGMEAVEKPRPLKKTMATAAAPKPKWV